MKRQFKEYVKFVKEGDVYVGTCVNMPMIIAQAKTLPELEHKIKVMFKMTLDMFKETLEQDRPFEFYQMNHLQENINNMEMTPVEF